MLSGVLILLLSLVKELFSFKVVAVSSAISISTIVYPYTHHAIALTIGLNQYELSFEYFTFILEI